MSNVCIKKINKIYDNNTQAVYDFDIDIKDGEFIVLVGPSGCGKSTTLRMIAGLEEISSGDLYIDDKNVNNVASKDRDIAMVFQNYALYSHMSVYQNMAFSLILRKENSDVIHEKVMKAANILGLVDQLNKKPKSLSGGQRQRVALGRAIVRNPKVFLLDEPLSNLDAKLRGTMRRELSLLHKRLKATMIYVTHDQVEALTLADRIVVMNEGYVQQIGMPIELYDHPANLFVASFLGNPPMNLIKGSIDKNGNFIYLGGKCILEKQHFELLKQMGYENKEIILGIRPEDIRLGQQMEMKVDVYENLGQSTLVHGLIGNYNVIIKLPGWNRFQENETIQIKMLMEKVHFFDSITKKAIM
jgi:multiple sugar transport system ATP-binding protein